MKKRNRNIEKARKLIFYSHCIYLFNDIDQETKEFLDLLRESMPKYTLEDNAQPMVKGILR